MALFKKKTTKTDEEAKATEKKSVDGADAKETKTENSSKENNVQKADDNKGIVVKYAPNTLMQPLVTEKASIVGMYNQYVFMVARDANKVMIKKAFKEVYNIDPIKVRVINVKGKKVRTRGSKHTNLKDWKKAIITLPADKSIDIYEK